MTTELFGLLDAMESRILEGKKVPLTGKILIEEHILIDLIHKIRRALDDDSVVRQAVDQTKNESHDIPQPEPDMPPDANAIIKHAQDRATQIRHQSDEYADQVLSHLLMMVTKMQKNIIKIEHSLEEGRQYLQSERTPDETE